MKKILIILLLFLILSILPNEPNFSPSVTERMLPMSTTHFFGTDYLGRDVFSLMVYGFQRTIQTVFISSIFSLTLGSIIGLYAGYKGGASIRIMQLFSNLGLIIPSFIAALIITSIFGFSPLSVGIALGFFDFGVYSNQVATLTQKVRSEDFVMMSRLLNVPRRTILKNHIFHHVFPALSTLFSTNASSIVLRYASLAFIGLGADITKPDWGMLLYDYRIYFIDQPTLLLWPSLGIFGLCLFFHLVFDNGGKKEKSFYE